MQLFSEKGLSLEYDNDKVLVRLYPQTDILVEVSRATALYLYHLINKYNNTIRTKQWSSFWRKLTQIERTSLVMFISSNTNQKWGDKFYFTNEEDLPQEFLEAKSKKRMPTSTIEVREELQQLFNIYMQAVVSVDEVKNYWEEHYAKTCEILKKYNQLDNVLKVCFEKEKIEKILQSVLQKEGYDAFEKPTWIEDYNEDMLNVLITNEIALFCSTGFQLASSKLN